MSDLGLTAVRAYAQSAASIGQSAPMKSGESLGASFGDMLNSAVSSVGESGRAAEGAISKASLGQADLVDVVTAVAAAEATLETVVAVRDEVIKAYQDILRMPI